MGIETKLPGGTYCTFVSTFEGGGEAKSMHCRRVDQNQEGWEGSFLVQAPRPGGGFWLDGGAELLCTHRFMAPHMNPIKTRVFFDSYVIIFDGFV